MYHSTGFSYCIPPKNGTVAGYNFADYLPRAYSYFSFMGNCSKRQRRCPTAERSKAFFFWWTKDLHQQFCRKQWNRIRRLWKGKQLYILKLSPISIPLRGFAQTATHSDSPLHVKGLQGNTSRWNRCGNKTSRVWIEARCIGIQKWDRTAIQSPSQEPRKSDRILLWKRGADAGIWIC